MTRPRPADDAGTDTGTDPAADDLRVLAVALHDLSRAVRRAEGAHEGGLPALPPTEFEVMRYVDARPGTSVGGVAAGLRLRQSNVSAAVRGLVARGLVERSADADDRRVTRLHPTPHARERRQPVEAGWARTLGAALADLPAADAEAVRRAAAPLARLAARTAERRA
ncbi:MarR family winged helix-turn-helix transcriptional regulator [Cellulomonas sp. PS-H5]|uniref:MarR family winged helix-turn-helix transcriptional regulator n=1 Tax=Cellulomonas sp. PS-H5 TaxID=2820400 RepID=UPI001C4FCFCA|nr:MarR family winged helix-turn-helix transcriptional regulator [Cellulomonas sp. PS-H5]MBW0253636.1 MarR family winged helix-turn-helix transcriptional regulator [Cellulomonas sp. PS-H5]